MYKTLLFFVLLSASFYAQTNRTIFFGKVFDDLGVLENVHIINLNTNSATKSNFKGEFKIFAKEKDSLKITFVGYKTKVLILKKTDFGINEKQINLKKEIIELDEVEIKKHTLTGSLENDIKLVPNKKQVKKSILDFSNIDFSKKVILPDDEVDDVRYPDMLKITDPTQKPAGITLLRSSIFTRKKEKRLKQRLNKELQRDKLPDTIIHIIGESAFIQEFNIPKDKIYQFLEYCGYEKLKEFSDNTKTFELIEFLNLKSKLYLKIINENQ